MTFKYVITFKVRRQMNTTMPANTAMPANTDMLMFLTSSETKCTYGNMAEKNFFTWKQICKENGSKHAWNCVYLSKIEKSSKLPSGNFISSNARAY